MRPARKARGGRIPGVCNRRATPRPGMQRRPNVTGLRRRDTSSSTVLTCGALLDLSVSFFVYSRDGCYELLAV